MRRIIYLIICFTLIAVVVVAQPGTDWVKTYDIRNHDYFYDIYKVSGGGYIMCGKSSLLAIGYHESTEIIVVRIDNNGNLIWSGVYGDDGYFDEGNSVIESDEGDFFVVGTSWNRDDEEEGGPYNQVLKINTEGDELWRNNYAVGFSYAVIELKSGEILIAGGTSGHHGYILCIDTEGEIIWQESYDQVSRFRALRETEGGVVASGYINGRVRAIKVDFNGELIWSQSYYEGEYPYAYAMVSSANGGFAIAGSTKEDDVLECMLLKIDDDGERTWLRTYNFSANNRSDRESFYGIERMNNGDYVMVGNGKFGELQPIAIRTNGNGVERWRHTYRFDNEDPAGLGSLKAVIIGHDGSVIGAGWSIFDEDSTLTNGMIIKLEPEVLEPIILHMEPRDTVFSVLPGDSIQFTIRVRDQQGDDLTNLWIMGNDTLGNDTTETITFEELGEYLVQCEVSDGEFTSRVRWHVTAEEWYLDSYSPDGLSLSVRRPSELDFNLDVRAIEGIEPQFSWIITDRNRRENDLGNEAEMTYTFDLSGGYVLEGTASHEDVEHTVTWEIEVSSVLWWWTPHEHEFEAEINVETEFSVVPSNPDSDSLEFRWLVDDEFTAEIEDVAEFAFNALGIHTVTAVVHDGREEDNVVWTVTVVEPDGVNDGTGSLLPTDVMLYPPAPNPFNSTTSIRYFLPRSADVRLTVYDSAGRFVQTLFEGIAQAGEHRATMKGTELSAGVYLLRLETGELSRSLKVVLLK